MFENILFAASLIVALGIGYLYFRDLGDVSQMFLSVKRENMVRFIRNEYRLLAIGLGATVLMAFSYFFLGGGNGWVFCCSARGCCCSFCPYSKVTGPNCKRVAVGLC